MLLSTMQMVVYNSQFFHTLSVAFVRSPAEINNIFFRGFQESVLSLVCLSLQFFSIGFVHFSQQNRNSQKCLFNSHFLVLPVHIIKSVSQCFQQIANAFVHHANGCVQFSVFFIHYQLLLSCYSKSFVTEYMKLSHSPQKM